MFDAVNDLNLEENVPAKNLSITAGEGGREGEGACRGRGGSIGSRGAVERCNMRTWTGVHSSQNG